MSEQQSGGASAQTIPNNQNVEEELLPRNINDVHSFVRAIPSEYRWPLVLLGLALVGAGFYRLTGGNNTDFSHSPD